MKKIPSTHTTRTIELKEFGLEGRIVLSTPNVIRSTAIENSVMDYILSDEDLDALPHMDEVSRQRLMTRASMRRVSMVTMIYALGTIVEAPFHLNDYASKMELDVKSFADYIADKRELYNRILEEYKSLENADPLSN